jgi:hypothetical protein
LLSPINQEKKKSRKTDRKKGRKPDQSDFFEICPPEVGAGFQERKRHAPRGAAQKEKKAIDYCP